MRIITKIIICLLFLSGCSEYTPKPTGYNRIEKTEYTYQEYVTPNFSFSYPSISQIEQLKKEGNSEYWFNISYPEYQAKLYCSYISITPKTLRKALEDSYHLTYSHTLKAEDINQTLYDNPENNISGSIYDIGGNVATPIQFYVTDSIKHFLRGSLYFETQVNEDSVAPVIQYIRKDIITLIESTKWK